MKLQLESLEHRCLLTALRLASWNTLNGPNDPTQDADFATILQAIGSETIQGNTTRVSLLALQETDTPGAGLNSIGRIEAILEGLYPGSDYGTAVTSLDGGGDATGFVYDTSTLSLMETFEITAGLTHNTLRGKFRLVGTTGVSDFFVYSTHLKAGTTAADETQRATEVALLRANADALGEGASVIMAGDLNLKGSSEQAYVNFLAAGAGQLQDPINTPGNWNDNAAFRSVHTQNPQDPALGGGGMDDRFDFQLLTGEFFDGFGVDYVQGSYHAFGNNGTHALNGSITTGTGAAPAVLQALAVASDHLPVVADYQLVTQVAGVNLQQSGGTTKVIEGGIYDTYSLVLTSVPIADVTITVQPDTQTDLGAGAGVAVPVVFTPADAFVPRTVVVTAVDDTAPEGTHTSTITHAVSSLDPAYQQLPVEDVVATVLDNDAPTILINEIDADTPSTDMLEFVELYDGGVGNASLSGKTLVFYNGATDTSYAAFDLDGFSTDSQGFFLLGNAAINPDIIFANNFLQNGADAVALYAADASAFPNGTPVRLTGLLDAIVYDTDDADDPGLLPLLLPMQPQVNENQNNSGTTESLSRIPDFGNPRETMTYRAQSPTPGALNSPPTPGVLVRQTAGRTDVTEGGATDSYTIELLTFPTADVTITVSANSQLDLGSGPGVPLVLTFTPASAIIPQAVTVMAVDDSDIEGPHTALIIHTAASPDPGYNGISIGDVVVNITDNEQPPTVSVVISEIMYNPNSDESPPGIAEWIEVVNTGNSFLDLGGWLFDDEDATNWGSVPTGTILNVDQVAVFFDQDFTTPAQFRTAWNVPAAALVIGIPWGSLANDPSSINEILQLLDNGGSVQDEVNFDDSGDWPTDNPDGPSIYLTDLALDNNLGTSWARSVVGVVNALNPGLPFSSNDVGSPGRVPGGTPLPDGDFNNDGSYDCADINALVAQVAAGSSSPSFDLTGDGALDLDDVTAWLAEAGAVNLGPGRSYLFGDATLDGVVDGSDFIAWNLHKFTSVAEWCSGDFTADGVVDGLDFIQWNTNKFTSAAMLSQPSASAAAAAAANGAQISQVRQPAGPVPMVNQATFLPIATRHDQALSLIYGNRRVLSRLHATVDSQCLAVMDKDGDRLGAAS